MEVSAMFRSIGFMFFLTIVLMTCENPSEGDGAPIPPIAKYVQISEQHDALPGFNEPESIDFEVTFTGDDDQMPYNDGHIVPWLLIFLTKSDQLEGVNSTATGNWYWYDSVSVGDQVSLSPSYQLNVDERYGYRISLNFAMHTTAVSQDSILQIMTPDTNHLDHVAYDHTWGAWNFDFHLTSGEITTGF